MEGSLEWSGSNDLEKGGDEDERLAVRILHIDVFVRCCGCIRKGCAREKLM